MDKYTELEVKYLVLFETEDIDNVNDIDLLDKYGGLYALARNKHISTDEYKSTVDLLNVLQDIILERMN